MARNLGSYGPNLQISSKASKNQRKGRERESPTGKWKPNSRQGKDGFGVAPFFETEIPELNDNNALLDSSWVHTIVGAQSKFQEIHGT